MIEYSKKEKRRMVRKGSPSWHHAQAMIGGGGLSSLSSSLSWCDDPSGGRRDTEDSLTSS
jgi:hypothetical protein